MLRFVRDGQQLGDVRGDRDAEFPAERVIGIFCGTITRWPNAPTYPLRVRMRESADFLLEAIAPGRPAHRESPR